MVPIPVEPLGGAFNGPEGDGPMTMKRRDALKVIGGLAAASASMGFQAPSADDIPLPDLFKNFGPMMDAVPIKVEPDAFAPGLGLITGPGGNITTLIGRDGLFVVDAFVPSRGVELVSLFEKLNARSITLINTHWHFDHAGGNAAFGAVGARIIAHDNTRKRLGADQYIADFGVKVPASPPVALPVTTFDADLTIHANGEEVHLSHFPDAHTDGDVFVHYKKANVLQTGDLFSNGFYPNIDSSSGGWIGGMIAAADRILTIVDARTKIVPGHGPLATRNDLKAARDMLQAAMNAIAPLVAAGKTVDEVVAARPLAKLDAKWANGAFKGSHFARIVYSGLAKRKA